MKTIQVTIEVEVANEVEHSGIAEWINCHMDNIPYEELVNFIGLETEDISIVGVY